MKSKKINKINLKDDGDLKPSQAKGLALVSFLSTAGAKTGRAWLKDSY